MPSHNPQIDPIELHGRKSSAVLLLHGFTATPDVMRPLANHLHQIGFSVFAPLLAGHGATREILAASSWRDWYKTALDGLQNLQNNHDHISVVGLSMGGLLALKLAAEHPDSIHALVSLATPLHLATWIELLLPVVRLSPMRWLYKYQKKSLADVRDQLSAQNYWSVDEMPLSCIQSILDLQKRVRRQLHNVQCPTLIVHSKHDSTAPYSSLSQLSKQLGSTVKETLTLENSYHLLTIDVERELVSKRTADFIKKYA